MPRGRCRIKGNGCVFVPFTHVACVRRLDADANRWSNDVMAAYIQIGVCTEISLDKSSLGGTKMTRDQATSALNREILDLSLFEENEDERWIRWILPRALVEEGMVPFLRSQYALFQGYGSEDPEEILAQIAEAGSYDGILALARGKSIPAFQASSVGDYLSLVRWQNRMRVRVNLLVYLVEGKAILEGQDQLFGYIEGMIHTQKTTFPIAAAVKVFLE